MDKPSPKLDGQNRTNGRTNDSERQQPQDPTMNDNQTLKVTQNLIINFA